MQGHKNNRFSCSNTSCCFLMFKSNNKAPWVNYIIRPGSPFAFIFISSLGDIEIRFWENVGSTLFQKIENRNIFVPYF